MTNAMPEQLRVVRTGPRISGVRVGQILSIDAQGLPLVDFPGNPLAPQRARCAASLSATQLTRAAARQQQVLLVFEADDPGRPLAIDVLAGPPAQPVRPLDPPRRHTTSCQPTQAIARLARITGIEEPEVLLQPVDGAPSNWRAHTAIALRNLKDEVVVLQTAEGRMVIVGQLHAGVPMLAGDAEGADLVLKGASVRIEAEVELVLTAGACQLHLDARGKALTTAEQIVSRARGCNKVQGGTVQLN